MLPVAFDVASQFGHPVVTVRGGPGAIDTSGVLVPEAAVHEHNAPVTWENNIRASRKIPPMKTEAKTERM
jgi:hypothetical protein